MYEKLLLLSKEFYETKGVSLRFLDYNKYEIDAGGGTPRISYGVVKAVWNLCYVYYVFYDCFVKGVSAITPYLKIKKYPYIHKFLLQRRNQIINYLKDSEYTCIDDFVNPDYQIYVEENDRQERKYIDEDTFNEICEKIKKDWMTKGIVEYWNYRAQTPVNIELMFCLEKVNKIASYALLFLMLHEFSHTQYKGEKAKSRFECLFENITYDEEKNKKLSQAEELECDNAAVKIFNDSYLGKLSGDEKIAAEIGLQMAVLYLNFYSAAKNEFGGSSHPQIYERLISIFQSVTDKDDKAWCMLIGAMSFEFYYLGIKITHKKVFRTFEDVAYDYVERMKNYVIQKRK